MERRSEPTQDMALLGLLLLVLTPLSAFAAAATAAVVSLLASGGVAAAAAAVFLSCASADGDAGTPSLRGFLAPLLRGGRWCNDAVL